jgi:hypothetical protein
MSLAEKVGVPEHDPALKFDGSEPNKTDSLSELPEFDVDDDQTTLSDAIGLISLGVRRLPQNEGFNHKDNPHGYAVLRNKNGDSISVDHTAANDHLVSYHEPSGEFRVQYNHSAHAAGILDGHMRVRDARAVKRKNPSERTFAFFSKDGVFYPDASLIDLVPKSLSFPQKHSATFAAEVERDGKKDHRPFEIAIDDIHCISYKIPGKLAITRAKMISSLRHVNSNIKHKLTKDSSD